MSTNAQSAIAARVAAVWRRNLPEVLARLTLLDEAATAAAAKGLRPGQRLEAASAAHKLAGSLGMFGFPRGTELAREIERLLESCNPDPAALARLSGELRRTLFEPVG